MKSPKIIYRFLAITLLLSFGIFNSCEKFINCENVETFETAMLIDISDEKLFSEINEDFTTNFSSFMSQTIFADIQECQIAKFSIGNLSGKDELEMKSVTLGIKEKGLSRDERRKRTNPTPIVQLVKESLTKYNEMSKDVRYNTSTNILGTMIKSILTFDIEADNTLVIITDGVINNKIEDVNLYKSIPKDAKQTIQKLIDPILEKQLNDKLEAGLELKIVIVLKEEQSGKVKKREVKAFWSQIFNVLNINDVQYIDNLTNKIIWDN